MPLKSAAITDLDSYYVMCTRTYLRTGFTWTHIHILVFMFRSIMYTLLFGYISYNLNVQMDVMFMLIFVRNMQFICIRMYT
jgi:hypothetical protein